MDLITLGVGVAIGIALTVCVPKLYAWAVGAKAKVEKKLDEF